MKNLCLAVTLLFCTLINAQDFKGTIEYEIEYQDLADEMKAHEGMFPTWMTIEIDGDQTRVTQPNAMGEPTVVLTDKKSGESIVLMDLMGQKLAIKSTKEDSHQEKKEAEEQSNIEYIKGETKEISGYECKKAIIKTEDGGEAVIYYTEDLPNVDVSDQAQGIKGFPMEMMVVTDMMTTITRVNSIQEGKVEKIKMVVPEGYDLKTKEEFKQMFGGGM